jgi:hypothetical protein
VKGRGGCVVTASLFIEPNGVHCARERRHNCFVGTEAVVFVAYAAA